MAKSGTDEHQRTVAVRKCTNGPCTAAYLAIYSFRQVIRADPTPVFGRKIHVSQGFANAFLNLLGCGQELHFAELGCNGRRLFLSCFFALLRMDCFEHQGNLLHLSLWRHREDVPVNLFHTFRCTENLTKSVFVDANSDQNGYILNLTTPAALAVNAVDVNVWVFAWIKKADVKEIERSIHPPALHYAFSGKTSRAVSRQARRTQSGQASNGLPVPTPLRSLQ